MNLFPFRFSRRVALDFTDSDSEWRLYYEDDSRTIITAHDVGAIRPAHASDSHRPWLGFRLPNLSRREPPLPPNRAG